MTEIIGAGRRRARLAGWLLGILCSGNAYAQSTHFVFDGLGSADSPAAGIRRAMADRLKSLSAGRLRAVPKDDSPFRSEQALVDAVLRNDIQVSIVSDSTLVQHIPTWAALRMPFLFDPAEGASRTYERCMRMQLERAFRNLGLELLGRVDSGWIDFYTAQPLGRISDLQTATLRQPVHPVSRRYLQLAGMALRDVPYKAIAPSLESRVVVGGEFTLLELASLADTTPIRQVLLTQHALSTGAVIANRRWVGRLTVAQRRLLRKAFADPDVFARVTEPYSVAFLDRAASAGIEVRKPSAAEASQWRSALRNTWPQLIHELSPEARAVLACAAGTRQ
jgi:TRAP-type C4-dicarboxylate transport system substrate-binding protein